MTTNNKLIWTAVFHDNFEAFKFLVENDVELFSELYVTATVHCENPIKYIEVLHFLGVPFNDGSRRFEEYIARDDNVSVLKWILEHGFVMDTGFNVYEHFNAKKCIAFLNQQN